MLTDAVGKANSLTIVPNAAANIIPPKAHKRVSCLSVFFSTFISLISMMLRSVLTSSIFCLDPELDL
jgi:hypothetical protein